MVAHDDDDRAVVDAELLQLRDDAGDLAVGEGNLAVVGVPLVPRGERLGRVVRRVRVVQVDPGEERPAFGAVDPRERLVDRLVAGPLDGAQRHRALLAEVEVVEVGVEALVDAPLRVEDVGGDEAAGAVAVGLQDLGERQLVRAEEEASVVAHAVLGRELAGEQARVRGQGERRDRLGLLEQDALAGELIEGRRLDVLRAVRLHAVGARRVERHHHQVQRLPRHAGGQGAQRLAFRPAERAGIPEPDRRAGRGHQREGGRQPPDARRAPCGRRRRGLGAFRHTGHIVTRRGRRRQCGVGLQGAQGARSEGCRRARPGRSGEGPAPAPAGRTRCGVRAVAGRGLAPRAGIRPPGNARFGSMPCRSARRAGLADQHPHVPTTGGGTPKNDARAEAARRARLASLAFRIAKRAASTARRVSPRPAAHAAPLPPRQRTREPGARCGGREPSRAQPERSRAFRSGLWLRALRSLALPEAVNGPSELSAGMPCPLRQRQGTERSEGCRRARPGRGGEGPAPALQPRAGGRRDSSWASCASWLALPWAAKDA